MLRNLILALVIVGLITSAAQAKIIHVPGDYLTIQKGIDAAVDGDTVLIADGIYTGTGNKNLDFKGKAITVKSENGAENCVIDCQGDGRGFYFHSGESSSSVVNGFTVKNGSAVGSWPDNSGAGILCESSSPAIANNTIIENTADYGAGILCHASSATITSNAITKNSAIFGAGIFCENSSPIIQNNVIERNSVISDGGGMYCNDSFPAVINNTITGNYADFDGGGISCWSNSKLNILNTILWSNSPNEIYVDDSSWVNIAYSDIQGGYPGVGNIDADPLFVDVTNSDYHLQVGSPCIDAGTPVGAPVDDIEGNPRDELPDMGAYEYQGVGTGSIIGIVTDVAGNPIKFALVIAILGETKQKAFTKSDGCYEIPDLEPGIYLALCVKKGYKAGIKNAEVIAGQETIVNFKLKK